VFSGDGRVVDEKERDWGWRWGRYGEDMGNKEYDLPDRVSYLPDQVWYIDFGTRSSSVSR
jgi:hypothetical protein